MARHQRPAPLMLETSKVFAAAAYASRINEGKYIKSAEMVYLEGQGWIQQNDVSNRTLMAKVLADEVMPSAEDVTLGSQIMTHFKGLTFKLLSGKILNEFEQKALMLASSETMSDREIGVVASLPSVYQRAVNRQSIEDRIAECEPKYVAPVGAKVTLKGEVVRCVFSQQWNIHFITMITEQNQAVFFANKQRLETGAMIQVTGKVKNHANNYQTQLNYTKII